jgi:hypothetical protein
MARPGRPERNRASRSFGQLRRFHHSINSNKVFGIHTGRPAWDAVVEATEHRMRPIMLTAAAAIQHDGRRCQARAVHRGYRVGSQGGAQTTEFGSVRRSRGNRLERRIRRQEGNLLLGSRLHVRLPHQDTKSQFHHVTVRSRRHRRVRCRRNCISPRSTNSSISMVRRLVGRLSAGPNESQENICRYRPEKDKGLIDQKPPMAKNHPLRTSPKIKNSAPEFRANNSNRLARAEIRCISEPMSHHGNIHDDTVRQAASRHDGSAIGAGFRRGRVQRDRTGDEPPWRLSRGVVPYVRSHGRLPAPERELSEV